MSQSRLAVGWFLLSGNPVHAQKQSEEIQVKPPHEAPIRVGANVLESKLIHRVNPDFPVVMINEERSVYDVKTMAGHPLLNDAAIAAVKEWKYSPTLINSKALPVIATVTVVFNLKPQAEEAPAVPGK
jgi:hypothetical protein